MSEPMLALAGVPLKNRVIVAAGCHGADAKTILETSQQGVAAITTKTIVAQAVEDVRPCFSHVEGGFLNSVFGTTLSARQWFEEELPRARQAGIPIIASIAGLTPDEAAELAFRAVAAGADMVEMPTVCPHMGEILAAMFPGLSMPPPEVHDVAPYTRNIQAVKDRVKAPVIAKFSALFHANVVEWAQAVEAAGADAIACADAFGPAMKIDIESGEPTLGGPRGVGGLTGPALKPISLRMIFEMAQVVSIPLIGVGGVSRAEDAIEYFMAGAQFVGVVTAAHLRGSRAFNSIIHGIERWTSSHGYENVGQIVGLTGRKVAARRDMNRLAITIPQPPLIDLEKCTGCRRCEKSCVYDAIHVLDADNKAHVESGKCYGCGLCRDMCNFNAIQLTYFQ